MLTTKEKRIFLVVVILLGLAGGLYINLTEDYRRDKTIEKANKIRRDYIAHQVDVVTADEETGHAQIFVKFPDGSVFRRTSNDNFTGEEQIFPPAKK